MSVIHVHIVSAEGEIYSGDASMVFAPAKLGDVGIAPRHAPLLTSLRAGEVRVQPADGGTLMKILVSNDDGYLATGINVLAETLAAIADVIVVAPDRNHSGASNSLTLHSPLRIRKVTESQLIEATAVLHAIKSLRKRRR